MNVPRFAVISTALVLSAPSLASADMRSHPPVVQARTSSSGPVQAYACSFDGTPNGAVAENVAVRNRSHKELVAMTIRYRWYDASGAKIFDDTVAVNGMKLDSGERGKFGPPNGNGTANDAVARIVCSISQAQFADGSTWVAGQRYHGRLLPAAFSQSDTGQ